MAEEKILFDEFLSLVPNEHQIFTLDLNNRLLEQECDIVIKNAKNGYLVSYMFKKKTIMNWVFRKSGVFARIYGDNAGKYEDIIASLPDEMRNEMSASRDCKRWIDPNACSSTCIKGFVYDMDGVTYKKCRNDGMFFMLTEKTAIPISKLVYAELAVRKSNS